MPRAAPSKEELKDLAQRAHVLYDESIRAQVEPQHVGKFVAMDVDSGDFEVATKSVDASLRMRERRPDGALFLMRIGYNAAYSMGGQLQRVQS